ncbi:putative Iron-sulfur cluster co-chaperone protein HscB, mitochondrial [Hypsibius exemplaris]|uniref:Iron-sulfur cluster co-chaperone protein HscB, mitochondrial n=1 Tax=Hypsibius exemplaris TaxID=2072580 RepID=A0A1W0WQP0_HYPEX|nr:putative Iron-sulfur cluster co-chaperone protein HscB, mitochondrial [Hypsibius exemplaris]
MFSLLERIGGRGIGVLNLKNYSAVRCIRILASLSSGKPNYFDVFNLPSSYDLTPDQLTPKYRKLLSRFHPDKFHQKSEEEKAESEAQSRLINQAYRVLLNPLERGLYLLKLHNSPQDEGKLDISSDSLMNIYEINDELSELTDASRLAEIKKENDQRINSLIEKISRSFQSERIQEAKVFLAQLKYFLTIEERIRSLELQLGVVR